MLVESWLSDRSLLHKQPLLGVDLALGSLQRRVQKILHPLNTVPLINFQCSGLDGQPELITTLRLRKTHIINSYNPPYHGARYLT